MIRGTMEERVNRNVVIRFFSVAILCLMATELCWASLLINPMRVKFGPEDRSAELTLINTSNELRTYRLIMETKRAKYGGGYEYVPEIEAVNFPSATDMIRVSPRQVRLRGGERQNIRLMLRRPRNLAPGEYRSHLLVKAIPAERKPDDETKSSASISVNVLLSFSLPVIVQQGGLEYDLKLNNVEFGYDPVGQEGKIAVNVERSGRNAIFGRIKAFWTPKNGKEEMIAALGEHHYWPELPKNRFSLVWADKPFKPERGTLRILYEGLNEFYGKVFFEETISFTPDMIKTLPTAVSKAP